MPSRQDGLDDSGTGQRTLDVGDGVQFCMSIVQFLVQACIFVHLGLQMGLEDGVAVTIAVVGGSLQPAGSFGTGALAAFVATPCAGPFLGAALGAALGSLTITLVPIGRLGFTGAALEFAAERGLRVG